MKRTGPFTIHEYTPNFKRGDTIVLVPFGDVHRSTKRCSEDKWKGFLFDLSHRISLGEKIYVLGMGDYDDFMSAGERQLINSQDLHETTEEKLDEVLDRHVNILCNELGFLKGRIIGLLEGNHYGRYYSTGVSTTQKMCEKLKCTYLGGSSFIRLHLNFDKNKRSAIDIFAHHGKGGGVTGGLSINTVERMANVAEADIYLMAHDHQRWGFKSSRLRLTHGSKLNIQDRQLIFGRTGSFLKAYEPNTYGYVSEKCMRPSDIGHIEIRIKPYITHLASDNSKQKVKLDMDILV